MKNRPDHKIDELFNEAFTGFSTEPPGQVWERIQDTVKGSTKPKGFWFRNRLALTIAASVIVVAGISSVIVVTNGNSSIDNSSQIAITDNPIELNNIREGYIAKVTDDEKEEIAYEVNYTPDNNTTNNYNSSNNTVPVDNSSEENQANSENNTEKTVNENNIDNNTNETPVDNLNVEELLANYENSEENNSTENEAEPVNTSEETVNNTTESNDVVDNSSESNTEENNTEEVVTTIMTSDEESTVTTNDENLPVADHTDDNVSHNYHDYARNYGDNSGNSGQVDTAEAEIILPDPTKTSYTPSKFAIGLHYTSESIHQLSDAKFLTGSAFVMQGSSYDISLNFKITDRLYLASGIGYTKYNEDVYYNISFNEQVAVDSTYTGTEWEYTYEDRQNSYEDQIRNSYSFIRLPLYIRYKLFEANKFSFHITGGGIYSQIMNKMEKNVVIPDGLDLITTTRRTPEHNTYSFMLISGVNVHYKLSNFVDFGAGLLYKRNLSSYYSDNGVQMKVPYSIGFRAGFYFNF